MKKWSWIFLLLSQISIAQKRWTGNNGTAYWNDPLNWEGAKLPDSLDKVLLDNSFYPGTYEIILPDGPVVIESIEIAPLDNFTIRLVLPVTNLLTSTANSLLPRALTTLGKGYSVHLRKNAVVLNASGSNSGYALRIQDSIRIENGARYIHRSRTGHADLVNQLSRTPGTEKGVFRMENTDAASTLSISGRVFGSLELSSAGSSSGTTTYSSSGTRPVRIRGDLGLDSGTVFSLHLSDTVFLAGELRMNQAALNLSTGNRSSCIALSGNWTQVQSLIYESNSSSHTGTIVLNGTVQQLVHTDGWIRDSIRVVLDNSNGVQLTTNWPLPYELVLQEGIIETGPYQVQLMKTARLHAVPSRLNAGIDGTIRKDFHATESLLIPFRKDAASSTVQVRGYAGSMQLAYHFKDANIPGQQLQTGLAAVSAIEYWEVEALPATGSPGPVLEVSYADPQSGDIKEANQLTIAAYTAGFWSDVGAGLTAGSGNAEGGLRTVPLSGDQLNATRYALANRVGGSNVLPLVFQSAWFSGERNKPELHWKVAPGIRVEGFEVETAADGRLFARLCAVSPAAGQTHYRQALPVARSGIFYRIKLLAENQRVYYSETLRLPAERSLDSFRAYLVKNQHSLVLTSEEAGGYLLELFNTGGQLLERKTIWQPVGTATHGLRLPVQHHQLLIIKLTDKKGVTRSFKQFW
ncbi:hypothetical protein [Flavihumibacter sp. CACIAM 22H1]|uniref:hypothetical protein n=1 Tax=Flavihumibacter sp. CACIAM 22H1 TaxID=1812911 RepID=UPI0007A8C264|nr:hypothetical protein [Flavihumibacter sp. CACIAM 22H1]KYP14667.1 MAG: hypothetical protein A1D16_09685 [Flavihumibacter sp. CACIAM 22H1]